MGPDFNRKVYCILGLPFDSLDMPGAVARVRESVLLSRPCFFSTPNLSFAAAVQKDSALRDSVLRSDMSVPDGMPLIWAAKLMGVPVRDRVAGSGMFERLWHAASSEPIKLFFFGGADGVAARASGRINAQPRGLKCVGHESPGFGSVEAMSSDDRIERINATGAEFIVVSIGVAKGQAWIERNRQRLKAPVISYLGAVVNFVAGTVRRAPVWMQHCGLEWLWRIKEEPTLWKRYFKDGKVYIALVLTRVLPYAWHARVNSPPESRLGNAYCEFVKTSHGGELRLSGVWDHRNLEPLRPVLAQAAGLHGPLHIDLSAVEFVDSAVIGLLTLLTAHRKSTPWPCSISTVQPLPKRMLHYCCADYLLATASCTTS